MFGLRGVALVRKADLTRLFSGNQPWVCAGMAHVKRAG